MQLQQAEVIPGMLFRGRRVYLEQKGNSKIEVDRDIKSVRRDCLTFAMILKQLCERQQKPDSLIITPSQFRGQFSSELN